MTGVQYKEGEEEEEEEVHDGPRPSKIGNLFRNVFSKKPRFSTEAFTRVKKGYVAELEFATEVWEE